KRVVLTMHSVGHSLGTSEQLWNGFKDTLLLTLQFKAMQVRSGATEFIVAEAKERELLAQEVRQLAPQQISDEEVTAHFASLPARYFLIHAAKEIVDDLTLTHRFMNLQLAEEEKALEPVTSWHNEPDRGYSVAKIGSSDRAGLFCKITGSFSATGINILSARIFTRADGIVLDTFYVTDAATGNLVNREEREKFEQIL